MLLLGLESSCDDTAAALVRQLPGQRALVLSSVVVGQTELHASFGGVVPEIAARAHAEKLDLCVEKALAEADALDNCQGVCRQCNREKSSGVREVAPVRQTFVNPRFS